VHAASDSAERSSEAGWRSAPTRIDTEAAPNGDAYVVPAHIASDIAILPSGSLMWAGPSATPSYSGGLNGTGPTTSQLTVAILK